MQGWLFLTFIMVGSLVGVTGMRVFFVDPLPTTALNVTWFLLQIAPLLITLPSAMRGRLKGMFFLCLISILYFVQGILIIFDPALFYWGVAELFFALALCFVTALYVRKLREFVAANEAQDTQSPD